MTSPIDRANAAPASSADNTAASNATDTNLPPAEAQSPSATQSPLETEAAADEAKRRTPIRIGTQRYGVKPPTAVPKPVIGTPNLSRPVEAPARPAPATSDPSPAPAVTQTAPSEVAASAASAAEAVEPEVAATDATAAQAHSPAPPAQSPTAPAATAPAAPPNLGPRGPKPQGPKSRAGQPIEFQQAPKAKIELPNLRSGLSADLEEEYQLALGGSSLDEIIASEPKQAVAELEVESRHKGTVVTVHRDNVFIEIGGHHQGVAQLKNFATPPEPGAVLDVVIGRFNAAEGLYELITPGASVDVSDWSEVAEGMIVDARVTGHNKGGLEVEVNKLRGFIPASQVSMYRVEDLSQFVDEKFACVITEANPEKRNLVLSRRAVLEREKASAKENLLAELEVGQTREGTVRSLQSFGAFVDLGGVDGMVHISQLSWDRLKHADEVLQLGQKIKVKIQKIDPQTGKISLAFRDLSENPWATVANDFPPRARVKGTVTRLMEFGAFVKIGPGVEGLIHISELSYKRVFRVADVVTEGQEVEVMVLSVDAEQQRISLSLKALESRPTPAAKEVVEEEPEVPAAPPKARKVPLKGGTGKPSTGDKFGLKW